MKTGSNIRLRKDGRFEARYVKGRDEQGRAVYGSSYGRTYEEAEKKRDERKAFCSAPPAREMNLLILGAGSHGEEVMELAESLRIFRKIRFLDDFKSEVAIGACRDFADYLGEYPVAIPAVGDITLRARWMNELIAAGFVIPTLIHPSAVVSQSAEIGLGTVVCARATVGTGAKIGRGAILSSGTTVERNAVLPDWSYVDCGEVWKETQKESNHPLFSQHTPQKPKERTPR